MDMPDRLLDFDSLETAHEEAAVGDLALAWAEAFGEAFPEVDWRAAAHLIPGFFADEGRANSVLALGLLIG